MQGRLTQATAYPPLLAGSIAERENGRRQLDTPFCPGSKMDKLDHRTRRSVTCLPSDFQTNIDASTAMAISLDPRDVEGTFSNLRFTAR